MLDLEEKRNPVKSFEKAKLLSQSTIVWDKITVHWTPKLQTKISDLFNPEKERPQMLTSPVFTLSHPKIMLPSRWRMQLTPDFWYNGRQRTLAIWVWRQDSNFDELGKRDEPPDDLLVMYNVHVLGQNGIQVFSQTGLRDFRKGDCYGWSNFCSYDKMKHLITIDGRLNVKLEIKVPIWSPFIHIQDYYKNLTVYMEDYNIVVKKDVIMKKCSALRKLMMNLKPEADTLVLESFEVSPELAWVYKNMFDFMHTEDCSMLRTDIPNLLLLWVEANIFGLELLKTRVFGAMIDCLVDDCDAESVIFIISMVNHEIKSKPQYAMSYNTLKRFVFENMMDILPLFMDEGEDIKKTFASLILENFVRVPSFPAIVPIEKNFENVDL